ncbi:head maturation protease, ClpP-related [Lysinibacillus telephonicus]|uniref:head maturation protease, ClpP-related n=1 Tax=Lysinibacillus telephonicus TaxID=1714840 RepID=UPI003BA3B3F8
MRISVKGPIISDSDQWIYDWFGIPATSPTKVKQQIERAIRNQDNEIIIEINSGGGSVYSASEIYTAIRSFTGSSKGQITGLAASAASVIAMGCTQLEMSPTAQMMIHNAATGAQGDHQVMDDTSDFLQKVDQSIINAYAAKTGKKAEELKNMMNKTTWMTAQEALEHGFIDAIMFENAPQAVANADASGMLPQEVINKVRQDLLKSQKNHPIMANSIPEPSNSTQNEPKNQNKGDNSMNLEQLQNDYPELFKEVKNMGFKEGVQAENKRLKEIEDLAVPGNETLINKAKYEEPVTAEKLAVQIVKAQKELGATHLNNVKTDAKPLNDIPGTNAPEVDNLTDEEQAVAALTKMWGGK